MLVDQSVVSRFEELPFQRNGLAGADIRNREEPIVLGVDDVKGMEPHLTFAPDGKSVVEVLLQGEESLVDIDLVIV
jgi:hypothetical protein